MMINKIITLYNRLIYAHIERALKKWFVYETIITEYLNLDDNDLNEMCLFYIFCVRYSFFEMNRDEFVHEAIGYMPEYLLLFYVKKGDHKNAELFLKAVNIISELSKQIGERENNDLKLLFSKYSCNLSSEILDLYEKLKLMEPNELNQIKLYGYLNVNKCDASATDKKRLNEVSQKDLPRKAIDLINSLYSSNYFLPEIFKKYYSDIYNHFWA